MKTRPDRESAQRRWVALLVLVLVVAGAALARLVWKSQSPAQADPPSFARPSTRMIAATVTTTGTIRLRVGAEIRVGAQVSGIVRKLNVTVGSHIRKGDVIAEIDASGYQARLAEASAAVAVAEQDLRRTQVELSRAQILDSKQLVPRQQLQDAALARDEALALVTKAKRDEAVVATDMSYAVIRAPITGTVASVSTQEGETVAATFATPTFVSIIADHALELVAMVDETDIGSVARGDAVSFSVEAFPAGELTGRVERIAPTATIVSGVVNYEVEVAIDRTREALRPDMTADVTIKTAERRAMTVPNAAVHRDGDERYVFVADGERLVKRSVTVGTRDGNVIEIQRGITTADRVLTSTPPGKKD